MPQYNSFQTISSNSQTPWLSIFIDDDTASYKFLLPYTILLSLHCTVRLHIVTFSHVATTVTTQQASGVHRFSYPWVSCLTSYSPMTFDPNFPMVAGMHYLPPVPGPIPGPIPLSPDESQKVHSNVDWGLAWVREIGQPHHPTVDHNHHAKVNKGKHRTTKTNAGPQMPTRANKKGDEGRAQDATHLEPLVCFFHFLYYINNIFLISRLWQWRAF